MKTEVRDDAGGLLITASAATVTIAFGSSQVQLPADEALAMMRATIAIVTRERSRTRTERRREAKEQRRMGVRPTAAPTPTLAKGAA